MGKLFKLPRSPHISVPDESASHLTDAISTQLATYEQAELDLISLRENHADLFEKLDSLESIKKESVEAIKRLLYTKSGPPPQTGGRKTHVWAKGQFFHVEVQYKQKASYYDPSKMPSSILTIPGVVTEVDKGKCDELSKAYPSLGKALVKGDWMTPAVSVSRQK